ncbi:mucin-5AC-like [Acanthochromis polyacanthus]|uniref:mucin-5AC-like n=1 Tax=Acanthochromis polyacanthus TaxID=80966 RepID=UPI00223469CC|nr:mucin-5AC-like [Acanthochromis polyacanthus]
MILSCRMNRNSFRMSSTLRCFGVGVVLFSLALPTLPFSRGASPASCQGMTPVHIRAHPQDPQISYVSIRTSASTYLPGQLVTVTVRSSRDFMGFLLQARSVEGTRRRADGGSGVRVGPPVLVGGSWTLTPPGTHKLNCLSEGDAITHSDKQLKRNLSFVWRAPDVPTGDIRFYITVVQSYFVYWAGIESAVVHDGSRHWRGITTGWSGGASTVSTMPWDKVNVLPATMRPLTGTIRGTQVYKSIKTLTEVTRPAMEMSSSVTSASLRVDFPINQVLGGKNNSTALGSLQNVPSESLPGVTEGFYTSTQPEESRSFGGLDSTSTVPTNTPFQSSTSPDSFLYYLVTTIPLKDVQTESKDLNLPTETTTSAVPSTKTNTQRSSSENPRKPTQKQQNSTQTDSGPTESQNNPIKAQTGSWSQNPHPKTSSPKPLWFQTSTSRLVLQHQTVTSLTSLFPQTSSSKLHSQSETSSITVLLSESPTLQSFLQSNKTSSLPQAKLLSLQPQNTPSGSTGPQSTSSFHQETGTQTQVSFVQTDQPQSEIPPEASGFSSQPWSPTGQKLTPSSVTPQPFNTRVFTLEDLKSRPEITTMSPVFASVPSAPPPSLPESSSLYSSSSSSSLFTSSVVHLSSTSRPHPSGSVVTMPPFFRSTVSIHSSSSTFMKNQPRTAPVLSALPSPSPISTPPHLPSAQPSSSTKPYVTSINYSSAAPLPSSPSFSTPLTSSVTNSASASSSTISPTPSPISFTSSSISSSFLPSSSSSISFVTSPHPGPSPAPRRSLYNPFTSSLSPVPSQELTIAQSLLIQNHIASSEREFSLNLPTPRTVVHPNPKPHPNLKPNLPKADTKPNRPSNPSRPPDKEGKYPDIIPRHSAWELGMLLGCSAGLGMVLVVGVRYVYRQACGKRTAVTLNDREREYGRGERGMIQVQECGDLVRVRKIRENSFVLLAEYDILAPPGD